MIVRMIVRMTTRTPEQEAVVEHFRSGEGDALVTARAGTGKTSTIIWGVQVRPARTDATLCAFNKRIATELVERTKGMPGVSALTLHGIGLRTVNRLKRVEPDRNREIRLARELIGDQEPKDMLTAIARIANAGKEVAPDDAIAGNLDALERVALDLGLLPAEDDMPPGWHTGRIMAGVKRVIERSVDVSHDRSVSFADMLFVPLAQRLRPAPSDLVVVDEAQDMNLAQLRLAVRVRRAGGRIVVVGDDRQAIYAFRGAAPGALARVRDGLGAIEHRLTVTHRCAARIVAEAARIVPDFTAAPGAPEGIVRNAMESELVAGAEEGDFVLSRVNADLARVCLALLRAGKRARVVGKDIAAGLIKTIRRLSMGTDDLLELFRRLSAWRDREVSRALARGAEQAAQMATDTVDTIAAISEDANSVRDLIARIEDLFAESDGRDVIYCSTVHKAKGLEANRVWMLVETFERTRPKTDLAAVEESNLRYVAITRARRELVYVYPDKETR